MHDDDLSAERARVREQSRRPRLRSRRARALAVLVGAVLAAPGWRGVTRPVTHAEVLRAARYRPPALGVAFTGRGGGLWHAQYAGGAWRHGCARLLDAVGAGAAAPALVPPDHVARIENGIAAEYRAVHARLRVPWWWPGGGLDVR